MKKFMAVAILVVIAIALVIIISDAMALWTPLGLLMIFDMVMSAGFAFFVTILAMELF